jgi:hypothetical protein
MELEPGAATIGTLRETSLHAALKRWYARPGDELEVNVDGFQVDLRRGNLLVEFQTRNFRSLKRKLYRLIERHPVRVVHSIAAEKWIVRLPGDGGPPLSRRRSPKRGRVEDVFAELVTFPELIAHPNLEFVVLLTHEEEVLRPLAPGNGRRASWRRRGWEICDRRLVDVVGQVLLSSAADFGRFLPEGMPEQFTNHDLVAASGLQLDVAQKASYCLRGMGLIECVGQRGRSLLFARVATGA